MKDPIEHEIDLRLASGAHLKLLCFSDREHRWIFSYNYVGEKKPGTDPEIVNKVRLTTNYESGLLVSQFVLSMHVVVPSRLGQQFFVGVDISPGAKTYLEFTYERERTPETGDSYRLVEICKNARERVRLDAVAPALVKPIEFPFPVPDRVPVEFGNLNVPFRTNTGGIAYFELPARTLRHEIAESS